MSHLSTCIFLFFYNEPELDARIDPGMAFTPFPSSILDETRFEPTTFESSLLTTTVDWTDALSYFKLYGNRWQVKFNKDEQ